MQVNIVSLFLLNFLQLWSVSAQSLLSSPDLSASGQEGCKGHSANRITKITNFACSSNLGWKFGQGCGFFPRRYTNQISALQLEWLKSYAPVHLPIQLKTNNGYVFSLFISLPHACMFKYQVDNTNYVKFPLPIHQTDLFNICLPVHRSIKFFGLR